MAKKLYKVNVKRVGPETDRVDYDPQGHDTPYPSIFRNHGDQTITPHKHGDEVELDYEAEQKALQRERAEAEKRAAEEAAAAEVETEEAPAKKSKK